MSIRSLCKVFRRAGRVLVRYFLFSSFFFLGGEVHKAPRASKESILRSLRNMTQAPLLAWPVACASWNTKIAYQEECDVAKVIVLVREHVGTKVDGCFPGIAGSMCVLE